MIYASPIQVSRSWMLLLTVYEHIWDLEQVAEAPSQSIFFDQSQGSKNEVKSSKLKIDHKFS